MSDVDEEHETRMRELINRLAALANQHPKIERAMAHEMNAHTTYQEALGRAVAKGRPDLATAARRDVRRAEDELLQGVAEAGDDADAIARCVNEYTSRLATAHRHIDREAT